VRVAIVGGTGGFGTALASRLKNAGYDVVIGSREERRAQRMAAELGVEGATNDKAARAAELVVLATKADAAVDTARALREAIDMTPVLSVASELRFTSQGVLPTDDAVSCAERLQAVLEAPVVAGLHSLAAATLGGDEPPDEDVLVCGDDGEAKLAALDLAGRVTGGRAIDAGPLASARALEGLTAVIVNINRRYRARAGIRITGIR
jgi:NADPH-dependent F420 reductase